MWSPRKRRISPTAIAQALLAACLVLFDASTVCAGELSGHATFFAGVRYTDNVLGAPLPGPLVPTDAPRPVSDVGIEWRPGCALRYADSRLSLWLAYAHPMLLYLSQTLAHQSGDVVSVRLDAAVSPRDAIDGQAVVSRSNSTLNSLIDRASDRAIEPVRSAAAELLRANGMLRHRHEFTERWSSEASFRAELALPIDDGSGIVTAGLFSGARYARAGHAFGLGATVLASRLLGGVRSSLPGIPDGQVVVGPEAQWSWDWAEHWTSSVKAGLVSAVSGFESDVTRPTASVMLGFDRLGESATLSWERAYAPNALTGQVYFGDTVALKGAVTPFSKMRLEFVSGTGLARARVVDSARFIDTDVVTTWIVDVGLGWTPRRWPRFAVAYQLTHQVAPNEGQLLLPSFTRNVVGVSVEYAFPPPSHRMPTGLGRRVDGADREDQ